MLEEPRLLLQIAGHLVPEPTVENRIHTRGIMCFSEFRELGFLRRNTVFDSGTESVDL